MTDDKPAYSETITDYWFQYYTTQHCTLCGNSGVIDTTSAITAAGLRVGRKNWCICPNGQVLRNANQGKLPE